MDALRADLKAKGLKSSLGYYDKDGRELGMWEWAKLFEDKEYARVAETTIKGEWWVSTVWLGLDHNFSPRADAPPVIFETMVFARPRTKENAGRDYYCERYETLEQARVGHLRVVSALEAGVTPENL